MDITPTDLSLHDIYDPLLEHMTFEQIIALRSTSIIFRNYTNQIDIFNRIQNQFDLYPIENTYDALKLDYEYTRGMVSCLKIDTKSESWFYKCLARAIKYDQIETIEYLILNTKPDRTIGSNIQYFQKIIKNKNKHSEFINKFFLSIVNKILLTGSTKFTKQIFESLIRLRNEENGNLAEIWIIIRHYLELLITLSFTNSDEFENYYENFVHFSLGHNDLGDIYVRYLLEVIVMKNHKDFLYLFDLVSMLTPNNIDLTFEIPISKASKFENIKYLFENGYLKNPQTLMVSASKCRTDIFKLINPGILTETEAPDIAYYAAMGGCYELFNIAYMQYPNIDFNEIFRGAILETEDLSFLEYIISLDVNSVINYNNALLRADNEYLDMKIIVFLLNNGHFSSNFNIDEIIKQAKKEHREYRAKQYENLKRNILNIN